MEYIEIFGGRPLMGEVEIQGSKNAALPILAAAVLHDGITVLHNCPKISDVMYTIKILEEMGCRIFWEGHSVCIDAKELTSATIPAALGDKMRSSIILMGALLGRMRAARVPYPGGCTIGERPIDIHVDAFTEMGAHIVDRDDYLEATADRLNGTDIRMKFPSVGATENIILAAILSEGTTTIRGGAKEPEIVELCNFLNEKGADIRGAGTETIDIIGVPKLFDSEYTLMPDRIVAGTYMMAVIATQGRCRLCNAPVTQMGEIINVAKQIGAMVYLEKHDIIIDGSGATLPVKYIETAPYPGFPTDLQSQILAVLSLGKGESRVREGIFEARFKVAQQLKQMGARIVVDGREAMISRCSGLHGCQVEAADLRGGAALVIAGLAAKGRTRIDQYTYIKRGYEDICADLRRLGADIALKTE